MMLEVSHGTMPQASRPPLMRADAQSRANHNMVWAGLLVETLVRLGLKHAVISPGSRSGPLTCAFAEHADVEKTVILDERSAAFYALGLARRSGRPAALVCTSGTAGANYYPAVIEAHYAGVPLLLLTADRPPEMRQCSSGQTIDQVGLFGRYPRWQADISPPAQDPKSLRYLRQTLVHAWSRACGAQPGPVHLNVPFRDPLAPVASAGSKPPFSKVDFERLVASVQPVPQEHLGPPPAERAALLEAMTAKGEAGVIVAGPASPPDPRAYAKAVGMLSRRLGWPVLAEGLGPLRNYSEELPYLVSGYDCILRNQDCATALKPHAVLSLGPPPTSKVLRTWLEEQGGSSWILDPGSENTDPLHRDAVPIRSRVELFAEGLQHHVETAASPYASRWLAWDAAVHQTFADSLLEEQGLVEGKVAWLLSRTLPAGTPLFVGNSMPVRDIEYFWEPGNRHIIPFFNRGANGIDGTLSTALGVAHGGPPAVLLTGDLALLHDGNGFLARRYFKGSLTIIVLNNQGGGIFENLPIAGCEPPFEEYFVTPQGVDFGKLCRYQDIEYIRPGSWDDIESLLSVLPGEGLRLVEIACDRRRDVAWRRDLFSRVSKSLQPID